MARYPSLHNHRRTQAAATFISEKSCVLDLGAGRSTPLKSVLPQHCTYVPADMEAIRDAAYVSVNLNKGEFPQGAFDVIVLLGVIEYLENPIAVLREAAQHAPSLIISYGWSFPLFRYEELRNVRRTLTYQMPPTAFRSVLERTGWSVMSRISVRDPWKRFIKHECVFYCTSRPVQR